MRPVNLIPGDERRSGRATGRRGIGAYVLIGGLFALLAAVTVVVITNNRITGSEAEIASLEQEEQAARARAESLRAFADFAAAETARTVSVTTLAQSRFDWQRVLRELAVVIPRGVSLKSLTGTVSPAVSLESETTSRLRDEIAGPALAMNGCAAGQEGVAALIAALEDIDGVTRVGLATSEEEGSGDAGSSASAGGDCFEGASFDLVVAFDEVEVEAAASTAEAEAAVTSTGG